jgi:hypothetical protein
MAWQLAARVVVTVCDPRDAIVSVRRRFGSAVGAVASWAGLRLLEPLCRSGYPFLRYEDGLYGDPTAVARLARCLQLEIDEATADTIFAAYKTETGRAFAATVAARPPHELLGNGTTLLVQSAYTDD